MPQLTEVAAGNIDYLNSSQASTMAQENDMGQTTLASNFRTKPKRPLRRGKWTTEEESYVKKIIDDFSSGMLPVAAGTTLRSYLSEKLNCDPMRITKKFTGAACVGKRIFHPMEANSKNQEQITTAQETLKRLEANWLAKLEDQRQQEAGRRMKKGGSHVIPQASLDNGRPANDKYDDVGDPLIELLRTQAECKDDCFNQSPLSNAPSAVTWLKEAQEALTDDVPLHEVESLLGRGESICLQFGIYPDNDSACSKVSSPRGLRKEESQGELRDCVEAVTKFVDEKSRICEERQETEGTPCEVLWDPCEEQCDMKRQRFNSNQAEEEAAGGLLVQFIQAIQDRAES